MANNPYVNKVVYGGQTLIDISDTTATADKILQGYTAYSASGQKITGTATSGGGSVTQDQDGFIILPPDGGGSPSTGGLVYETGTWTPSEDVYTYNISFSNAHTKAPFYVIMIDATETYSDVTQSNYVFEFIDFGQVLGFLYVSDTVLRYGYTFQMNRATNVTALSNGLISNLQYPSTDSSSASVAYPRYWVTESGFRAYTNSANRYWRAGRTYKWIAVWAPTA